MVVVVCSGVACPRAAVAAVKKKKSRAEAESAAWEMCATGKTGHVDNCPFQPRLQHQLLSHPSPLATSHRLHGRHHAGTQPTTSPFACPLAPHPAATDNVSFGPVLRYVFFFFLVLFRSSQVLQSRRRRLCLVARKSVAAASNPSPPPPAYHRHLQPIAAASNPLPRPPTHRRSLQPIAAASDSSPQPPTHRRGLRLIATPRPLSPPLTARKGLHNDT
ncbi:hypothetical protein EDB84DRAFT_1546397, partial [Lactarius hengduanensis]